MSQRILHLVGWFLPQSTGGSEVYVDSLCRALSRRGHCCEVGIPRQQLDPGNLDCTETQTPHLQCISAGATNATNYDHQGITVHRFIPAPDARQEPGGPGGFQHWLKERMPDIVHMHTVTQGLGLAEAEVVHALKIPLVLTVHAPDVLCARGTMMRWGSEVCDGRMDVRRCAACYLQRQGLPRWTAAGFAAMPPSVGRRLRWLPGRWGTGLRMSAIIQQRRQDVLHLFELADRVIAVCQWLYDALLLNGVPVAKLHLCRQGTEPARRPVERRRRAPGEPLRLGYLGRYTAIKGVDRLVQAVRSLPPDVPLKVTLHGSTNGPQEHGYLANLQRMSKDDSRIRFAGPLSRPQLPEFFASIDLLAVPSVWLETGPLVVLEALAHGVPVLGSKRGGIAELVQDGVNGLLVPVDTPAAWRDVLARLVREPLLVEQLRVEPPAVRTWAEVAEEMEVVYGAVIRGRAEPLSSCEQFLPIRD